MFNIVDAIYLLRHYGNTNQEFEQQHWRLHSMCKFSRSHARSKWIFWSAKREDKMETNFHKSFAMWLGETQSNEIG